MKMTNLEKSFVCINMLPRNSISQLINNATNSILMEMKYMKITHIHTLTYIRTYIRTYIHIYMYIFVHTHWYLYIVTYMMAAKCDIVLKCWTRNSSINDLIDLLLAVSLQSEIYSVQILFFPWYICPFCLYFPANYPSQCLPPRSPQPSIGQQRRKLFQQSKKNY